MSKSASIEMKQKRHEILELVGHICVGLSVFMKGIDKFEHHHVLIGWLLLILGLMILGFSAFNKKIEFILGRIKYFILGIEGFVMLFIGYSYYQDGSHLIHYAYYLTAILFFTAIPVIYFLHKNEEAKKLKIDTGEPVNEGAGNSIASQEEKN
jgi:hypothetical protein